MDLQSWFFTIAIVYMVLLIIFVLFGITVLFQVYWTIKNAPKIAEETVSRIFEENKGGLIGMAGMAVLSLVVAKMKSMFKK